MNNTDYYNYSTSCGKCGGFIDAPLYWHSTFPPRMCNCPIEKGAGYIGWICPKCNKGQNPLNDSCNCEGFKVT